MMRVTYSTRMLPVSQYRSRVTLREGEVKLEPDLLRDLLLYIEEHATEVHDDLDLIKLHGWTDKQVAYHVVKANEAGLVDATIDKLPDDENPELVHIAYSVHSLRFPGHELLGTIREPRHWTAIKDGSKKAGPATIGALVSFGEAYVRAKASEYLGITSA